MTQQRGNFLEGVGALYSKSLHKHGAAAKGVGWGDVDSHVLRFEKLTHGIEKSTDPISVNDLGCGYGALFSYLRDQKIRVSSYRGHDISEDMLREARAGCDDASVEFVAGSQLDRVADYSFASGIFNVRLGHDEESWRQHILETLDNMNECSSAGFAFNLLTSYVDWREDHLYYGDSTFFFDHCKRHYAREVALLHDYPLWEWTIVVRK